MTDIIFSGESYSQKNICNNEKKENGVFLFSKHKSVSEREIASVGTLLIKIHNIVASKHKPYDCVFISYNEFCRFKISKKLLKKYRCKKDTWCKRYTLQAHIQAAKICSRDMFWIVDADAVIVDEFDFEYFVEKWIQMLCTYGDPESC